MMHLAPFLAADLDLMKAGGVGVFVMLALWAMFGVFESRIAKKLKIIGEAEDRPTRVTIENEINTSPRPTWADAEKTAEQFQTVNDAILGVHEQIARQAVETLRQGQERTEKVTEQLGIVHERINALVGGVGEIKGQVGLLIRRSGNPGPQGT